jgi:endonuclease III
MAGVPQNDLPAIGARVLAFHPQARAWRPATVKALPRPGVARVHFAGYAVDDGSGQAGGPSEFDVQVPEELEALAPVADFLTAPGEQPIARAWRGVLHSLAAHDPRVYGERRAAAAFDPASPPDRDLYALLVAAMLDADARIPGGAALMVRLRGALGDCDPRRLAAAGEAEIAQARAVMPSPLRARVLFSNARRFLELDASPGGFRGWLTAQPDPVAALCAAFDRLDARAAVLFLRHLGSGAIAPDDALTRVAQRLGLVRRHPAPTGAEVRDAWLAAARAVGDAPPLLDLTVRRFADSVCQVEPRCATCAVPDCPSRRVESDLPLLEEG